MDNYRRPASPKRVSKSGAEGFIPAKTKTADQTTQPYRHAVETAAESSQGSALRTAKPLTNVTAKAPASKFPPIDMTLPDGDSFNRHHMTPRIRRQVRRLRQLFLRTAMAAAVLLIGGGSLLVSQGFLSLHHVFKGTAQQAAALQQNVDPSQFKSEGDSRVNILLTGIGGGDHPGADLTDSLIIASIDPVTNKAALLSVPRDLWVTIPGKGSMKINAAYAMAKYEYMHKHNVQGDNDQAVEAGFGSIDQTLESVLGIPISYNVLVNFQAFRQAVDTVGGVDINVPTDLYDPTMAWENNRNPYLAKAGNQHFDGVHALIYARSRETSSDFARAERQRAVLLALKQKAVTLGVVANPTKLAGLMKAFGNNVQTDLSLGDASHLYSIFKKIDNGKVSSVSLAGNAGATSSAAGDGSLVTTGDINGQSIVQPKAGLGNYDAIQEYVRTQLQDGYILKEHANVLVINGSVQGGLAEKYAAKLKSYGYNVTGIGQTSDNVYPTTQLVALHPAKAPFTKHYLEQRFGVTAASKLPDSSIQAGSADFVIILGSDASI